MSRNSALSAECAACTEGRRPLTNPIEIRVVCGAASVLASDEDESQAMPPHVLLSRRRAAAGWAGFSVCSGQGRTLKGRDLSRVRDAVLRMTGFIES